MPGLIIVGAQWGDEGKGKLVDALAEKADWVVRFQGGANAGHTIVVKEKKIVLHLIPSGILRPETTCVIAPATVVDPEALCQEIEELHKEQLLTTKQLLISDLCTLVLPYHKALDQARESKLGKGKIGTTGRGIGPAYEDRAARKALLFRDLFEPEEHLKTKIRLALEEKNALLQYYQKPIFTENEILHDLLRYRTQLEAYRGYDVGQLVYKALKGGKKILFEGAQGTLLDIYHGTYPFVTSSSTVAAAAPTSLGIGPQNIQTVVGVIKAYTTRVGNGPFPSELSDETGEYLRQTGQEFGATTGRPRRCGWLDLVALRYSIRLNGITNLAMMKLDVLSGLEKIGVCVGYEKDGKIWQDFPPTLTDWDSVKPVIEYLPGWKEELSKVMTLKDLPRNATAYIDFVSSQLGTPIDVISVGPAREQTLWVKPLFN